MLGFKSSKDNRERERESAQQSGDVAKLFFDRFSGRIAVVEGSMRTVSTELEKLKTSLERGQISDLVLLDKLQKHETLIRESLVSIKAAIEKTSAVDRDVTSPQGMGEDHLSAGEPAVARVQVQPIFASHVLSPTGEIGSLPSITTPTELQVLTFLTSEGSKSAPEIGKVIGRSREHTARLMKKLFEEGYIRRDQTRIPFRYSVVDRLKQSVRKVEAKGEEQEAVSVPQS